MSMPLLLGIAAVLVIIGGVIAAAVLGALASGTKGPQRFEVSGVGPDVDAYFDKGATWAATVETTVPAPAEHVWQQLSAGDYLGAVPFVTGPHIAGLDLSYRAVLIALSERIVRNDPAKELVAVGTGLSIPLLLTSFGERWVILSEGANTKVQWTVALTPQWIGWFPLRWTAFVVRPFMRAVLKMAIR
ncbi:SRPBCC family protein [Mycobacterium sp. NPDC050853]|uniref:SRPBCC family protein n=1 Tax=Mycobacterium sp. NPDC050853 TaxID=3155160 RepID=UPI003405575C